jgi:uncharacterized phage protein gp47/JayE
MTEDQILDVMLGLLKSAGFPVMSWAPKAIPRRLLRAMARAGANLSGLIPILARSGFGALALGDWLDVYTESFYNLARDPATFTVGQLVLEDIGGVGPETFVVGQLWAVSADGHRYRNTTGGTLPLNGTISGNTALSLTFEAENEGAAYNVAVGDITELATPIPGIRVSNPVIGATGTWITEQGVDEESDPAYFARGQGRWSTLGVGGNDDFYRYNARTAAPAVTRVQVLEATPVPGDSTLYLAGPEGPAGTTDVTAVQAWFDGVTHHVLCTNTIVHAAVAHPITLTGSPQVLAAYLDTAKAAWTAAFTEYRQTLDIGAKVVIDKIVQLIMDQTGVQTIVGLSPGSDVVLASNEVAVFTDGLTWVAV